MNANSVVVLGDAGVAAATYHLVRAVAEELGPLLLEGRHSAV